MALPSKNCEENREEFFTGELTLASERPHARSLPSPSSSATPSKLILLTNLPGMSRR